MKINPGLLPPNDGKTAVSTTADLLIQALNADGSYLFRRACRASEHSFNGGSWSASSGRMRFGHRRS
jgi:hypothetical protein